MLNYVWSFLVLTGLIASALFGTMGTMMDSVFVTCESVVLKIALPLAGKMMLWLGLLRVMEKAGLMERLALLLSPVLRRLFPDVPTTHPAMGAITMNISANLLGLGNSATPLGLKAMGHLQEINPNKRSASNAMCMFLALNTAGITLIPMQAITFLSNGGMKNPYAIIMPTLAATMCAALVAVCSAKLLQRLTMFRSVPDDDAVDAPAEADAVPAFRPSRMRRAMIVLVAVAFAASAWLEFFPAQRAAFLQSSGLQALLDNVNAKKKESEARGVELQKQKDSPGAISSADKLEPPRWRKVMESASVLAIPVVFLIAILWALAKGVPVYEEMVEGAKEGFGVAVRIMPFLVIMLTGMTIFRDSGALWLLEYVLRPMLEWIHLPVELLPMAVMRPLSGSGASGLLNELILRPGASDFIKYTAAVMYGSTETTFYVLAVYFGSVGIRKIRHALAVGIIADVTGMICAITLGRLLFAGG